MDRVVSSCEEVADEKKKERGRDDRTLRDTKINMVELKESIINAGSYRPSTEEAGIPGEELRLNNIYRELR